MNNEFSENIKKIRKENHLSQEQLAEELGVSRQAISKWESGAAYPEMDKIIYICKKYNVNIDDLLHKDIKEVKGEEEVKKNLNKYIEEFFKFITDSVNMFIRMKLGGKIKLLFEEGVIAFVLFVLSSILFGFLQLIVSNSPLSLLPLKVYSAINGFLGAIYALVAFIICVVIMIRIFKTRYLDYYQDVVEKQQEKSTTTVDNNIDKKLNLKEESKIIVRDPKNSDYHLLRGLLKLFLLGVKLFALWIEVGLCGALVFFAFAFIMSFLVAKTGIFFLGCILGSVSAIVALSVVIILLFNFIFNRKSNKKLMIWSFVASIIIGGMSIGLITMGTINFDFMSEPKSMKTDSIEIDMNDNSFINYYQEVEYIPEERDNIRIEVEMNELCTSGYYVSPNGAIHLYNEPKEPMKLLREELKEINNKKIYPINSDFKTIKIYASQDNINKLNQNSENYHNDKRRYEEELNELRNELNEKNRELEELRIKVDEYELNENSTEEE